ncbi:GNAT family N-acetyltransferase [Collimonas sp.]|jgi:hypothetical protein|uniref:GNAT family N-acetyltransferase n=1 Tax=Collimonas sp. TaxID=1963772 RepID=UPI002BD85675|nr:GNAT family N-acetyltransferase [Collimonas sp.]HWX03369.1 GNAT family N-acetyltransferase [Collimonas sp.]
MRDDATSISNLLANTSIDAASFLDIPFVFDLIVRGSMDGTFTDSLISSGGYVTILLSLFASLHFFSRLKFFEWRGNKQANHTCNELLIFSDQTEAIGFLQITSCPSKDGSVVKFINKCAIKYELRRQGYGRNMMNLFLKAQPIDTKLAAYCNPYAKGMQHIFRQMHFRRTSIGHGLNLYTLGNFDAEEFDAVAQSHSRSGHDKR